MSESPLKNRLDVFGWGNFDMNYASDYMRDVFLWMEEATREIERLKHQVEVLERFVLTRGGA